jgi:hypothetical protein
MVILCGSMASGPLAVATLHGVAAGSAGPCLHGYTVWQHGVRSLGCCDVARCGSRVGRSLFTWLYCVAAGPTGPWLLRRCTVWQQGRQVFVYKVILCGSMASGPLAVAMLHGVLVCRPGHCLRVCTVCGSMHDGGPLAVARLHGVLVCRPGHCLRGSTVWQHARWALGCCEVAR